MKLISVLVLTVVVTLTTSTDANAQQKLGIKKQVFAGIGTTAGRKGFSSSVSGAGGFALVVPIQKKTFFRPFVVLAEVKPAAKPLFCSTQFGGLLGIRASNNFSVLVGGGASVLFQKSGTAILPTAVLASVTRISNRVAVLTPITLNERGFSTNVQLGYTW